jgi:hypothetical protein
MISKVLLSVVFTSAALKKTIQKCCQAGLKGVEGGFDLVLKNKDLIKFF